MKFSIGSDPEFILIDENYRPKSSIGILQSKTSSFNKIYYDNVLAEVQVKPSFKKECFVKNIKHSLNELSNKIKPFRISTSSFCNFPIAELEHKDSFKFGCESEYCAYELERIQKNNIKTKKPQESLFVKQYKSEEKALQNHERSMENMHTIHRELGSKTCNVLPPLLVRYDDPKHPNGQYIPIKLGKFGKLLNSENEIPDAALHFHSDTSAITVTVCKEQIIQKEKWYDFFIHVLYAMRAPNDRYFTVEEWTNYYDEIRIKLLSAWINSGKINL